MNTDQRRYARLRIVERPLDESYQAKVIEGYKWAEWIDPTKVMTNPHGE